MDMPTRRPLAHAEITASLYFWWLAFLRCSRDYWWCCQQSGRCQDPRLVRVWEDFGNVFRYPCLMHWWQEHGAKLFDSPQLEMRLNKYLASGLELLIHSDLVMARPHMVCMAIPLYLDTEVARHAILDAWEGARVRGVHYDKDATYQVFQLDLKGRKTIVPAYRAWALNVCVQNSAGADGLNHWGSFEMGRHLNLSPRNQIRDKDGLESRRRKQALLRTLFWQSKKAAADLIANVEIGKFPCKNDVQVCPRWTVAQQISLDKATLDGRWQASNWMDREYAFMLPEEAADDHGGSGSKVIDMLDEFGAVATPFLQPKRVRAKKRVA